MTSLILGVIRIVTSSSERACTVTSQVRPHRTVTSLKMDVASDLGLEDAFKG